MSDPERPDWEQVVGGIASRARAALAAPAPRTEELDETPQQRRQRVLHGQHVAALEAMTPPRYRGASVTHREVADWVRSVRAGDRTSLVLTGPTGVGKTHQAYAALAALVHAGIGRPVALTVPAFLDGLRPSRPGTVDYDDVESAGVLLLDDLAAERATDWTAETLYRLIDHRWAWQQVTIVTMNVPPRQVRERMGDRIASRLAGMGRLVALEGQDRRTPPTLTRPGERTTDHATEEYR